MSRTSGLDVDVQPGSVPCIVDSARRCSQQDGRQRPTGRELDNRSAISHEHVTTDEQMVSLLDLPPEVLENVLCQLPSTSLVVCMYVHPVLAAIVQNPHFRDMYTRHVLRLSQTDDKDVDYSCLPCAMPPLMELWFLSYSSAASSLHMTSKTTSVVTRPHSPFFRLDCFHHSVDSYLVQTQMTEADSHQLNSVASASTARNVTEVIHQLMSSKLHTLPMYVLRPLTKLALALPRFMEKTILTTQLNLHKGKPKILQNVWHEGFPAETKNTFTPEYCLEIICGQTVDSRAHQSSILLCFDKDRWILWTGSITQFPGCKISSTWTFSIMKTTCQLSTIKALCHDALEDMFSCTVSQLVVNGPWKRRQFYPGFCHILHDQCRQDVISSLGKIEGIPNYENENSLCGKFHDRSFRDGTEGQSNYLAINSFCLSDVLRHAHTTLTTCDGQEKERCSIESHLNLGTTHLPCQLKRLNKMYLDNSPHRTNNQTKTSQEGLTSSSDQTSLTPAQLVAQLHEEMLVYITDLDSHQILCPACSRSWFADMDRLTKCIRYTESLPQLPYYIWPYHLLVQCFISLSSDFHVQ